MVTQNSWNSEDPAQVAKGGTGRAALTAYNIAIGAGTSQVTLVAPSATGGVPLISQGAAVDPAYGTTVVAGGGTGRVSNTAYAVVCGGTTATAVQQSIAGVGTSGQILTSNGAGALPTFQAAAAGGGILIQQVTDTLATTGSTATNIPADDTIPQKTEGAQILSVTITPTNASNILQFAGIVFYSTSAIGNRVALPLFQDTTANALAASFDYPTTANVVTTLAFRYQMVSGTTSSTTFNLRIGPSVDTVRWNGINTGRLLGGALISSLTVSEITV